MVLYIGITNSLGRRIQEHTKGIYDGFTRKYKCHYLLYYELFIDINMAIKREKEIKGWRRDKKLALIKTRNPDLEFMNLGKTL